jgi:diguanylate cyclase (GGDEF)-like protein
MLSTSLCKSLGIKVPIIVPPLAGSASTKFAAAVSNAGALGSIDGCGRDGAVFKRDIDTIKRNTSNPFAVYYDTQTLDSEQLRSTLTAGPRAISFSSDDMGDLVQQVHDAGLVAMVEATTTEEAGRAAAGGADVIIAHSTEGGGKVGAMALLPQIVDAVSPTPVVASCGIVDGRGVAAALVLGAAGVSLDPRWMAKRSVCSMADTASVAKSLHELVAQTETAFALSWNGGEEQVRKLVDALIGVRSRTYLQLMDRNRQLIEYGEHLSDVATRDALTGVLNRGAIMRAAEEALMDAAASGQPVGFIMADIDHFKCINDELGHPAGDMALREFTRRIGGAVRQSDRLGRYGGEEFLIVVAGPLTRETLSRAAERLREAVNAAPFDLGGVTRSITASFGATVASRVGVSVQDVIGTADHALYVAKRGGRNRVVIAEASSNR